MVSLYLHLNYRKMGKTTFITKSSSLNEFSGVLQNVRYLTIVILNRVYIIQRKAFERVKTDTSTWFVSNAKVFLFANTFYTILEFHCLLPLVPLIVRTLT